MAGRPRATQLPALPRSNIPDAPEHFTLAEKAAWEQARIEVDLLGTYTDAFYTEFFNMVRLDAAEAVLDMTNLDTPATRVIAMAATKRVFFGRNPAASKNVAGSLRATGQNPDDEFTGGERPPLRVVPDEQPKAEKPAPKAVAPKPVATPTVATSAVKPPPWLNTAKKATP